MCLIPTCGSRHVDSTAPPATQPPQCPASQPRLKMETAKVRGGASTGRAKLRQFQRPPMLRTQPAIGQPSCALGKVSSLALRIASRSQCWTRNRRTLSLVVRWSPRADADAHARRRQPSDRLGTSEVPVAFQPLPLSHVLGRRCGHRAAFCGIPTSLSAALSLPARATKRSASSDAGRVVQPLG